MAAWVENRIHAAAAFSNSNHILAVSFAFCFGKIRNSNLSPQIFWQAFIECTQQKKKIKAYGEGHGAGPVGMMIYITIYVRFGPGGEDGGEFKV